MGAFLPGCFSQLAVERLGDGLEQAGEIEGAGFLVSINRPGQRASSLRPIRSSSRATPVSHRPEQTANLLATYRKKIDTCFPASAVKRLCAGLSFLRRPPDRASLFVWKIRP